MWYIFRGQVIAGIGETMEKETFDRMKTILIMIGLTIATLAVYWQVQFHDFINYDDPLYVDNPMVRLGLSWDGIRWAFQSTMAANWHPLTWLSHMLDFQIFGKNPAGHHLTNLFFHLANTLLLFLVLKEMTSAYWRSALVAAMFALHPLHVESVAWVAERKDVLSTFFFFLTLAFYVYYVKKPAKGKYVVTLFFFILGLLTKPMLVTLPFVLVLLDFWPLGRIPCSAIARHRLWPALRPLLFEKIPFFVCSLLSCMITYHVQSQGGGVTSFKFIPVSVRISNAIISYTEYLDKAFWPRDLAVFYPYADVIFLSKALGAALIILFISIFAAYSLKRIPYFFVGWFWYLGTLIPVIGFVQAGIQALADRYTYIPLIGIFVILSWGMGEMARAIRYRHIALSAFTFLLLAQWAFTSWHQVSYWKNSISLLEHTISVTPDNPIARNNLGLALAEIGKDDEAMRHFREILRSNPVDSKTMNNLGTLLQRNGQPEEAQEYFRRAIQSNPHNVEAHINLGAKLAATKNPENRTEAIQHFLTALRIKPSSFLAHFNLGLTLLQSNTQDAIVHFEEAVRLNPKYGRAHLILGVLYSQQKLHEKATFHVNEALKCDIDPGLDILHKTLSDKLLLQGNIDEALSQLETAVRMNPDSPENHFKLGNLLMIKGRVEEARHHFGEALRLDPSYHKAEEALMASTPSPPGSERPSQE
jgi:protein O-mannosyl-transferase